MKIRFYHARILTMKEKEAVFEGEAHIKIKICLENIKLKTKDVRNDNVYFFLC